MGCGASSPSDSPAAHPVVPASPIVEDVKSVSKKKPAKKESPPTPQQQQAKAPPQEKKQLVRRDTSEGPDEATGRNGGVASAVAAVPCDADGSHSGASVWCPSCESHWCATCDERIHATKLAGHKRTALASSAAAAAAAGGKATSAKFSVKEKRGSRPASGEKAAAVAASSGPILNGFDEQRLGALSVDELEALWSAYDKNGDDKLNRAELKSLANDVIDRVAVMIRNDLLRTNDAMTPRTLDKQVAKEMSFALPGKNEKETLAEIKRRLEITLDVNGDGRITKKEFIFQWRVFANDMFVLEKSGDLGCSIM